MVNSMATREHEKRTVRKNDCSLICLWQNNLCEPIPSTYISATELFHKDPIANAQLFQVSSSTFMTQTRDLLYLKLCSFSFCYPAYGQYINLYNAVLEVFIWVLVPSLF